MCPFDCFTKPYTMLNPRPVPLPAALVEKNGSNTLSRIDFGMPWPVSLTAIIT